MSPAEAKMKARADALAAEQAKRAAQPVIDNRQLGGATLSQIPLSQRQAAINTVQGGPASRFGQELIMTPLAQRQLEINRAQGGPAQYLGQALGAYQPPQPRGPVRPQTMPQPRTGGPGQLPPAQVNPGMRPPQAQGPVRAPQSTFVPQPQARPEPTFMQQYGGIIQPLATAGIGALFKNLF